MVILVSAGFDTDGATWVPFYFLLFYYFYPPLVDRLVDYDKRSSSQAISFVWLATRV